MTKDTPSSSSQNQRGKKRYARAWMMVQRDPPGRPDPTSPSIASAPLIPLIAPPIAPAAPIPLANPTPPIVPAGPIPPLNPAAPIASAAPIPPRNPAPPLAPTPPIPLVEPVPPIAPAAPIPPVDPAPPVQFGSIGLDGRMHIGFRRGGLFPSSKVATKMRECIQLESVLTGYTFKGVSQQTYDFYWREFEKHCYWDAAIDAMVKVAYKKKFSKTYSKYVSKIKAKGVRPIHMSNEVWNSWKAYWDSPEAQQKSKQAKLNKHGGIENGPVSCHIGGSISQAEHLARLSSELGREPTAYEIFVYTHTRGHDGLSFVDERSQIVYDRMEAMLQRIEQSADDAAIQTNLFYEAVGGFNNRSRIYGLGFGAGYYSNNNRSSASASTSASSSQSGSSTSGVEQISQIENQLSHLQHDIERLTNLRHEDLEEQRQQGHRMHLIDSRLEDVVKKVGYLISELEGIRRASSNN